MQTALEITNCHVYVGKGMSIKISWTNGED